MKKLLLILLAFITLAAGLQSCKSSKKEEPVPTILVGGLFSITGNWNTLGKASKDAMFIAQQDINTYLAQKNAPFRIAVAYADTRLSPDTALLAFNAAISGGLKFLIGPQSSAELAKIMPEVGSKALVISQSSTAGNLSVAGDAVYRFCPPDKIEGAAIANTIHNSNIKGLVTIARDDAGNKGLQIATGNAFTALGGAVTTLSPYDITSPDFTMVISALRSNILALEATHGQGNVAVYLASFDECVALFKLANNEPILKRVKWFGGDGVALSAALLNDATAADFAIATNFFAPSFGLPAALEDQWGRIGSRIKALNNADPDAFALSVYDAMWTIAYTLEATNGNISDVSVLKTKFVEQAQAHDGITGDITLDKAGDRANGVFDYWAIKKEGGAYKWYIADKSDTEM